MSFLLSILCGMISAIFVVVSILMSIQLEAALNAALSVSASFSFAGLSFELIKMNNYNSFTVREVNRQKEEQKKIERTIKTVNEAVGEVLFKERTK